MAAGWVHMPRLAGIRPWYGGRLGAYAAFGRDTALVRRPAGGVCRVWPGYVPGMAGGRVQMPRLVGIRPRYGGRLGADAAFGRETAPVWRVGGCRCRVWPGNGPGLAGGRVQMPRLAGKRPQRATAQMAGQMSGRLAQLLCGGGDERDSSRQGFVPGG